MLQPAKHHQQKHQYYKLKVLSWIWHNPVIRKALKIKGVRITDRFTDICTENAVLHDFIFSVNIKHVVAFRIIEAFIIIAGKLSKHTAVVHIVSVNNDVGSGKSAGNPVILKKTAVFISGLIKGVGQIKSLSVDWTIGSRTSIEGM